MVVYALSGDANLQHALRLVVFDHARAQNLSQIAVGGAAGGVHLPKAILRGNVTLRDEEVGLRRGVDVGHAMRVAAHRDGRGEAGELRVAIELGKAAWAAERSQRTPAHGGKDKKQRRQPATRSRMRGQRVWSPSMSLQNSVTPPPT